MEVELVIDYLDILQYENITNFLVEKLDNSIQISPISFFHCTVKRKALR